MTSPQDLTFTLSSSCDSDTVYNNASTFPMNYDSASDTITIWGSNGSDGSVAIGNSSNNPITFEWIYQFGRYKRGACAVSKPATGSYAISTKLVIGNTSSLFNTTYVKTFGESVDFAKQVNVTEKAYLVIGLLTAGGSPYAGSTVSSSGTDATGLEQGQIHLLDGSFLEIYDSFIIHKTNANNSNQWKLYWNGKVTAKRSSFESWWTIRFLNANNSLEDIVFTNVEEGFYPAITQVGTLNTIKARKVNSGGVILAYGNNFTAQNVELAETGYDLLVIDYTGESNLVDSTINWSKINWTTGSYSGKINRKYNFELSITDSAGAAVANASVKLIDVRGDAIFNQLTDVNGQVPSQTITRAIYSYTSTSGDERGPHTLYIKKYGKNFLQVAKSFAAKTVETTQLGNNLFTVLPNATAASSQAGIKFTSPTGISYCLESHRFNGSNDNLSVNLDNYPATQSEYFALFANGTKLVENTNYTISYDNGTIKFLQSMYQYNVTPVYSYGGKIQVIGNMTLSNVYDYMQGNLSDVFVTTTGTTYTSYVVRI